MYLSIKGCVYFLILTKNEFKFINFSFPELYFFYSSVVSVVYTKHNTISQTYL